jgi:hypothetical protein
MPRQPKIYTYTYRANVTYELTIDAASEDEAFELMTMSDWLKIWSELKDESEIWLEEVQEAGPDRIDHVDN